MSKDHSDAVPARHALYIPGPRAIYTFIPKNACSTMRYSAAVASGYIAPGGKAAWIHQNTDRLRASAEAIRTCNYSFVVLRCPYRRLASVYLDKVVGASLTARSLFTGIGERIRWRLAAREMILSLTFRQFVRRIVDLDRRYLNHHWRPQADFLLFSRYDDYFRVEELCLAISTLKERIGFDVHDTRSQIKHDASSLQQVRGQFADTPAMELARMKAAGKIPDHASLFDGGLVEMARTFYGNDIALYSEHFGTTDLLF